MSSPVAPIRRAQQAVEKHQALLTSLTAQLFGAERVLGDLPLIDGHSRTLADVVITLEEIRRRLPELIAMEIE